MAQILGGQRWLQIDTTAEAVPGVKNSTQTLKPFRCVGGGIGLNPQVQFIEAEEHAGSSTQPAPVLSHTAPAGTVQVIPSPYDSGVDYDPGAGTISIFRQLLNTATTRTSGVLASHSIYDALPGLITTEYLGCKVNGFSIGFSGNPQLDFSVDVLGLNAGRLSTGLSAVGTLPSSRHWKVAQISMQVGADLTVVASTRTITAFGASWSNGITPSGLQTYYPGSRNDTSANGIQVLFEGEESCEGTLELLLEDAAWYDRFIGGTAAAFRLMAFHPDSVALTSSSSFTSTSNPTVAIAEDYTTGQIEVGDYALLQDTSAADPTSWKTEVLRVKAVTPAGAGGTNSVQFETDGGTDAESAGRSQSFAAGTRIFSKGMQIRIPKAKVTAWSSPTPVREKAKQTLSWRGELDSSSNLLKFMVR